MQSDEPSAIGRFMRGSGKKSGTHRGLWQRVQLVGVLIKNQLPAVLPAVVLQKVDIVIVGLDFIITGPFTIPAVNDVHDFVATIDEVEGDRPLIEFIA